MSINLIPQQRTYRRRSVSGMALALIAAMTLVGVAGGAAVVEHTQVQQARAATAKVKQDLAVRTEDMMRTEDERDAARKDLAQAQSEASSAQSALAGVKADLAKSQADLDAAHTNQRQLLRCASAALGAATDAMRGDYVSTGEVASACQSAINGARDTLTPGTSDPSV